MISAFLSLIAAALLPTVEARLHIESTVPGFTINNVHEVARGRGIVLRGAEPRRLVTEFFDNGVTDVVIFKNDTRTRERAREIEALSDRIGADHVHFYDFGWESVGDFSQACSDVMSALSWINRGYRTRGAKLYFHCTMGEDRTGLLAGLFALLREPSRDLRNVFEEEMCRYGYSGGDPEKPRHVVQAIDRELTPFFLEMARLIRTGAINTENLEDNSICNQSLDLDLTLEREEDFAGCEVSELFVEE